MKKKTNKKKNKNNILKKLSVVFFILSIIFCIQGTLTILVSNPSALSLSLTLITKPNSSPLLTKVIKSLSFPRIYLNYEEYKKYPKSYTGFTSIVIDM